MTYLYYARPCAHCGRAVRPARHDAKYCSSTCRVRAFRRRRAIAAAERQLDGLDDDEAAQLQALEEVAPSAPGRLVELVAEHSLAAGRAALSLAEYVIGPGAEH